MTIDTSRMPSLAGLRTLDAIMRSGSISAAAKTLGVSDSAIRQHVRGLEDFFGRPLFVRDGRTVSPTIEAVEFGETVGSAFSTLQAGVDHMLGNSGCRALRIALTPAFAENWLMPRLALLWQQHPDLNVELVPSIRVADLRASGIDIAIRYGQGTWPEYRSEKLASARYIVVATETFLSPDGPLSLEDLVQMPWLFEVGREEHFRWAKARGIDHEAERNKYYPTNSIVLSAARSGQGLSLQAEALVENDITGGSLTVLYAEDSGSLGYYVVTREDRSARVEEFVQWLISNA